MVKSFKEQAQEKINSIRKFKGISLEKLGEMLGASGSRGNKMQKSYTTLNRLNKEDIKEISNLLGVEEEEILGGNFAIGNIGNSMTVNNNSQEISRETLISQILKIKDPEERKLALKALNGGD